VILGVAPDHRDDLPRVDGSPKCDHLTASLLIGTFQATPRQNALTRAQQEYGHVARTLFLLPDQASGLNLVTNAGIARNTVDMAVVIDRLKSQGEPIAPEDLAHLSPARYDHIDLYGRYQFRGDRRAGQKSLRPIEV
jgi:TnpA family transposase